MKKPLLTGMVFFSILGLSSLAKGQDRDPQPTATPKAVPTVQTLKPDTYDVFILNKKGRDRLQVYPDFFDDDSKLEIPTEDELKVANQRFQKMKDDLKHYEVTLGLGGAPDITQDFSSTYTPGFSYGVGFGYRFSPQFSLMLDLDGALFSPNNDKWNGNLTMTDLNLAGLVKFRLSPTGLRPYLFFGPGIGISSYSLRYSFNGINGVDTLFEGAFLLEGGVGFEIPLVKYLYLTFQGRGVYKFNQSNYASYVGIDEQSLYLPIEVGITFGK